MQMIVPYWLSNAETQDKINDKYWHG